MTYNYFVHFGNEVKDKKMQGITKVGLSNHYF